MTHLKNRVQRLERSDQDHCVEQKPMSDLELARIILFVLRSAKEPNASEEILSTAARFQQLMSKHGITDPYADEFVAGFQITALEALEDGREVWVIRDQTGKLLGSAIGREAAEMKAHQLKEAEQ